MRAEIKSLATYVPPRLLTNADLEKMVETSNDWIMQRTGIRERHIVDAGVATSDLATEAARVAIERAGLTPADINLIIVGTVTPDMLFPSTACLVRRRLAPPAPGGSICRRRVRRSPILSRSARRWCRRARSRTRW